MKPRFIGNASAAFSIEWMCHGPGVHVVAKVPVAGPVPPPSIVVTPLASASSICCGQMKWMCESMPPAVRIMPSPAMISVPGPMTMSTPGCTSGLPALPSAGDAAGLDRDVGLDDAPVVDHERVGDDGVGDLGGEPLALAHAVADRLAAAELHFLAVAAGAQGVVVLDLDRRGRCRRGGRDRRPSARTSRHRRGARSSPSERSLDEAAKAVDDGARRRTRRARRCAAAGLEAHRGAGRDLQAHAARRVAVEAERSVGFGEVVVRADLDRPVAGVLTTGAVAAAGVELDARRLASRAPGASPEESSRRTRRGVMRSAGAR